MEAPRGRGAGINKPAWMVQKEREEAEAAAAAGGAAPSGGENGGENGKDGAPPAENGDDGKYADAEEDRGRRERSRSRDREDRDQFGLVGRGGSGGGGGRDDRYDDRGGYDDRYDDRRGGRGRRDDYDRRDNRSRDDYRRGGGGRSRGDEYERRRGGGGGRRRRGRSPSGGVHFHSYEEEREWLDDRRRRRRGRKSTFDIQPTPEQLAEDEARAALESSHTLGRANIGATGANMGLNAGTGSRYTPGGGTVQPQQTRHARRLYVGNIPDLSEEDVHNFFRDAIRDSVIVDPNVNPNAESHRSQYVEADPIISVYINRERRFAFLEFKTMEITSACLALDGIDVMGQGKVKVKRPNDYNAALAPPVSASACKLDTARLGIISPTVPDGPNKIFIGGLPYHLTESQVLELLGAFGVVKAFHLVKHDANSATSKGYCFVEYADPNITQVACMGLNGMDMGGGKQLSCKIASAQFAQQNAMEASAGAFGAPVAALPVQTSVVDGVNVDDLLSAALGAGGGGMPGMGGMVMPPQQPMGVMPVAQQLGMATTMGMMPQQQIQQPQSLVVTDPLAVANAAASALDAAFGGGGAAAAPAPLAQQPQAADGSGLTRILVLLNMVMDEDLASSEDHKMLEEEVREEVSRYGKLVSMKIPRPTDGYKPSAVKKIFLEYATSSDAANAEKELKGRAFGPNVVGASYFDEGDYARGNLS